MLINLLRYIGLMGTFNLCDQRALQSCLCSSKNPVVNAALKWISLVLTAFTFLLSAHGQTMKAPDITKTPTLYVVPYAHLDTQWRWEFPQTISEYLLKTMRVNFDYIDKYPHYVFNWTGANRYRLMKEYFPADYARMKQYVAAGRWFPAGSSVEEGDVNLPSAEGIFRQILYGNEYFRKDFGKASNEYMLPDCFGFPASLTEHSCARRSKGIFHAEAQRTVAACPEDRRT